MYIYIYIYICNYVYIYSCLINMCVCLRLIVLFNHMCLLVVLPSL